MLLLSTAQGKKEIKLDAQTDASACKILLPGREIYVDVTYGSDAWAACGEDREQHARGGKHHRLFQHCDRHGKDRR